MRDFQCRLSGDAIMNKIAVSAAAITTLFATHALAADMPVKAAPPAPAAYNWTGWYIGVNAGASFGNVKTDFNVGDISFVQVITGGPTNVFLFDAPGSGVSDRAYPDGFMGGGQIGYNWQFSPIWVVGLEADFQGALEKDHNTLTDNFSLSFSCGSPPTLTCPVNGTLVRDYEAKIDWFGTVRLRAGFVWGNMDVFSYVTGGLAYGKVDLEGTSTVSGTITGTAP